MTDKNLASGEDQSGRIVDATTPTFDSEVSIHGGYSPPFVEVPEAPPPRTEYDLD